MEERTIAVLLDQDGLNLDELAVSCAVSREWIIEHVHAGVLLETPEADPVRWTFTSRDLLRARRLCALERDFEANPELAGLAADLLDEVQRLRARLRRAGLSLP